MAADYPDDVVIAQIIEPAPDIKDDYRSKSAQRRRENMRSRLFCAAMEVCAEKGRLPQVIDEVVQQAGVARGSFYKYYATLDELIKAIGTAISNEVTEQSTQLMPEISAGLLGIAAGIRLNLTRASTDHVWGAFVVRSDFLTPDTTIGQLTRRHLSTGHADGVFVFALHDVAVDLVLGSVVEGIRRITESHMDVELYIYHMTIHILQSLGVTHEVARSATEEVYAFFRKHASRRLPWWGKLPARNADEASKPPLG